MQNRPLMRVMNCACDFHQQACSLARCHRRRTLGQQCGERTTLHELHAEERPPFLFADLVNWNDVRMIEPRRRLCFSTEPLYVAFAGELAAKNHLECDRAV